MSADYYASPREQSLSPRFRAILASVGLWLLSLLAMAAIVLDVVWMDIALRQAYGEPITAQEVNSNNQREGRLFTAYAVAFVLTAVAFLLWVRRVSFNLDTKGPPGRFSPGWAVGWWFIPVANFWRPYQVMRDIWARRHPDGTKTKLMLPWWLLWIISNCTGKFGFLGIFISISPPDPVLALRLSIFGGGASIVAAMLAVALVWQITGAVESQGPGGRGTM